jgi:hypothetical protein
MPNELLAFEYQGEQHYKSSTTYGSASNRQRIDKIKQEFANTTGITLVTIPFWWDGSISSLAATVRLQRPDLQLSNATIGQPIPTEIPQDHPFHYAPNVPQELPANFDPTGW